MILWELENVQVPFEIESPESVFKLLTKNKVRPIINKSTNRSLALLIRRCWQDNSEKRPSMLKVIDSLKLAEFN